MTTTPAPIPVASTDDAAPGEVLAALWVCAQAWEPNVRIIGNIRAIDIMRACDYATRQDDLRKELDAADSALARIAELQAALKPFAKAADDFGDHWLNCEEQWKEGGHGLDVGTLRRARAALEENGRKDDR